MVAKKSIQDRIAETEKQLEQKKNQLIALRQRESKEARAARTRELIQLGGLVAIAQEIHPNIFSPELILGVLDWAGEAAVKPEKAEMITSFCDRGRKILTERAQKK